MKKLGLLFLISLFIFSCTGSDDDSYGYQYSKYEDTSLAKVIVKGNLVVGIIGYAPPCAFLDNLGQAVGFDIDIFKDIATRLEVDVEFKVINWSLKDEMLQSGAIDCIASSFTFSRDRALSYALTTPTLYNAQVVVVRKTSDIVQLEDLKQKRIGYLSSSNVARMFEEGGKLRKRFTDIGFKGTQEYPSFLSSLDDLKLHAVDAVVMDILVMNYIMKQNPNDYRVLDDALTNERYTYAFRRGDRLLRDAIEKIMLELEYEGRVLELSKKWFGGDVYLFGR